MDKPKSIPNSCRGTICSCDLSCMLVALPSGFAKRILKIEIPFLELQQISAIPHQKQKLGS